MVTAVVDSNGSNKAVLAEFLHMNELLTRERQELS